MTRTLFAAVVIWLGISPQLFAQGGRNFRFPASFVAHQAQGSKVRMNLVTQRGPNVAIYRQVWRGGHCSRVTFIKAGQFVGFEKRGCTNGATCEGFARLRNGIVRGTYSCNTEGNVPFSANWQRRRGGGGFGPLIQPEPAF